MIGEVAATAVEISAKEIAKETIKETAKEVATKSVDISKRIEVSPKDLARGNNGVDISKRIIPEGVSTQNLEAGKELTPKQIKELINKGMSPGIVNDCTFKDGVYQLKTVNEKLNGSHQPETGVNYAKKVINLHGLQIEGVFPKFESAFTAQLPADKLIAKDSVQFGECITQLQKALSDNPALKEKFSGRQLEQIAQGKTPGGYTWHHNEEVGKMELVDTEKHTLAKHTGGKAVWGGGANAR